MFCTVNYQGSGTLKPLSGYAMHLLDGHSPTSNDTQNAKKEHSFIADGNVKCYDYVRRQFGD